MSKCLTFFARVGCVCLAGAALAPAQNVLNGSFELGANPGNNTTLFAVDSASITGWTVQQGSLDYTEGRWVAADGQRCLDMTGVSGGTLIQSISGFTVGQKYRLSFLMAGNPEGGPSTKSLRVSIGTAQRDFTFEGAGRSAGNMGWSGRYLDFTATNATLTLAFTGLNDSLWGAALDAVSVGEPPLELSIRFSQVEVCWSSVLNQMYQIQYRSMLTTNFWANLGTPLTGHGSNQCFFDSVPLAEARRFYQVIRLP